MEQKALQFTKHIHYVYQAGSKGSTQIKQTLVSNLTV